MGGKTYSLNLVRNRDAENRRVEGSVLEDGDTDALDLEEATPVERQSRTQSNYENSIWSTVVDIKMCKDFAAIKYENGKKVLHQRDEIEKTALYALFLELIKKYQPKDSVTARDFSTSWSGGRWRGQIYHCNYGWMISMRQMPFRRPVLGKLGIDKEEILDIARGSGLILFAGPTGAGKSTTMAGTIYSLMELGLLGDTVTIEDPIEFLYEDPFIQQRAVGVDVQSFHDGIHEAMRQSPDTIVIGEIRHPKTAEIAVQAGLTGHRVMATIHAESVEEACSRMFSFLDDNHDELLPQAIQGVIAQHLIRNEQGRVVTLYEALKFDRAAKTVLANGPEALPRLIHEQFRQNRQTLKDSAKQKLSQGLLNKEALLRWIE